MHHQLLAGTFHANFAQISVTDRRTDRHFVIIIGLESSANKLRFYGPAPSSSFFIHAIQPCNPGHATPNAASPSGYFTYTNSPRCFHRGVCVCEGCHIWSIVGPSYQRAISVLHELIKDSCVSYGHNISSHLMKGPLRYYWNTHYNNYCFCAHNCLGA